MDSGTLTSKNAVGTSSTNNSFQSPRDEILQEQELYRQIEKKTREELVSQWKRKSSAVQKFSSQIAGLHPLVRNFLLRLEIVFVYNEIAKEAGLSQNERNVLPQIIWNCALKKNFDSVEQMLRGEITDEAKVGIIKKNLEQRIISDINALFAKASDSQSGQDGQSQKKPKNIQISLEKALQVYPKIEQQFIGFAGLHMKYSPTPLNPSVRNWITDYHDVMGSQKHGALDRSKYLFQSVNGRNLEASSRRKLAAVLQSLDEGSTLDIEPENQKIVFNFSSDVSASMSGESGSVPDHSIAAAPAGGSLHNFVGQSTRPNQAIPSGDPKQSQSGASFGKSFSDKAGDAAQSGWNLANKMSQSQMGTLEKFAPQGMVNANISNQPSAEEKILEKSVGIGSEEYFQRKNEEYNKIYSTPMQQNVEKSSLKHDPRMRFESPQNPGVWQNGQAAFQGVPQAHTDLPAQSQAQPAVTRMPKAEDIQGNDPKIRGNIVDLSQ